MLRRSTAAAKGPDWPEQAWDSYRYDIFERTEWCVTVPFEVLAHTRRAVVPVAAAERILVLPDEGGPPLQPWERPPPGRPYRHYWSRNKRFLALVAEIAARFPEDGGEVLARELRGRVKWLPRAERSAVEMHCAALGLLDGDPVAAARRVLEDAAGDDLGARGELVLHALERIEELPEAERVELLAVATEVARRTTAFVASNPYAACVDALGRNAGGSLDELVELVHRAARLKIRDWPGWERALHAAGRWLTMLAAQHGVEAVAAAVEDLRRYRGSFPAIEPMMRLAGARGLPAPANLSMARLALEQARRLRASPEAYRIEAEAARLLAAAGDPNGVAELRVTAARAQAEPHRRARRVGLQVTASALAALEAGDGELFDLAMRLAGSIRGSEVAWLAWMSLATAPAAPQEAAAECYQRAERVLGRWRLRRAPLEVLAPLASRLAALDLRSPAVAATVALARGAAEGSLAGRAFAVAFAGLAAHLADPDAVMAVAEVADSLDESWWRLPLLALIADAAAGWIESVIAMAVAAHSTSPH